MSKYLTLFAVVLTLTLSLQAQSLQSHLPRASQVPTASASPTGAAQSSSKGAVKTAADTCAYTFVQAGANNSYMEVCVSVNGNLISFQSPSGIEYLNLGTLSEGYGLYDFTSGISYYDYSDYGASGFGSPMVLSATAALVKIQRTTTDGIWTLTQTIAKSGATTPFAKITMALKNNTAVNREVYLLRWADVDPFNANSTANFQESFDSTIYSAWGYTPLNYYTFNSSGNYSGYGLLIENIGKPNVAYGLEGLALNTNFPPSPSSPAANYFGYQQNVDGSIEMLYVLIVPKGKTGTVNLRYHAL